jgi:predicted metalloprotease
MRWDDFRQSENVEDYRGGGGYGGPIGMPGGAGGLGIGTVIILGLLGWILGIDPRLLIGGAEILMGNRPAQHEGPARTGPARTAPPTDEIGRFVAGVLGETEDRWKEIFEQAGRQYRAPKLTLFSGAVRAGSCGMAQSAMGPFYCPPDARIYLDTSFFRDLQVRFRGCQAGSKSCEFAHAYVIAHEVGHHVQNQLGILTRVQQAQRASGDRRQANQLQVRVELQADCLAGIWANREQQKRNFLEPGDIEAALQTAAAIGDDRLQRRSQGQVVPDSFTHGSSEQRQRWFITGFRQGRLDACNTFSAAQL